mmetsp:Transcript_6678/g.11181  ORF Transcript_6678/g.11181 Transcript_6678/m.11181 type:complete len:379 (+) Transcript_6678:1330-2466(+)
MGRVGTWTTGHDARASGHGWELGHTIFVRMCAAAEEIITVTQNRPIDRLVAWHICRWQTCREEVVVLLLVDGVVSVFPQLQAPSHHVSDLIRSAPHGIQHERVQSRSYTTPRGKGLLQMLSSPLMAVARRTRAAWCFCSSIDKRTASASCASSSISEGASPPASSSDSASAAASSISSWRGPPGACDSLGACCSRSDNASTAASCASSSTSLPLARLSAVASAGAASGTPTPVEISWASDALQDRIAIASGSGSVVAQSGTAGLGAGVGASAWSCPAGGIDLLSTPRSLSRKAIWSERSSESSRRCACAASASESDSAAASSSSSRRRADSSTCCAALSRHGCPLERLRDLNIVSRRPSPKKERRARPAGDAAGALAG